MNKRVVGIILIVLGCLAVLGGITNGSYAQMYSVLSMSKIIANTTTLLITAALIIVGIVLIIKSKKEEK